MLCRSRSLGLRLIAAAGCWLAWSTGSSAVAPPLAPPTPGWSRLLGDGQSAARLTGSHSGVAELPSAVQDMQSAADRLQAVATVAAAGDSQQAALGKLDATLAQLQKQCQQCMGGKRSKASGQPRPSKPGAKRGGANPNGAAVATGQGEAGAAAADAAQQAVRDLWGQLPQRQRDQMLQPLREEFLPQYADDIEAYFRGLAEPQKSAGGSP